jgi:hypothetical protein
MRSAEERVESEDPKAREANQPHRKTIIVDA